MKTVSISGSLRENVGKKDAKMNRKHGKIPCVLYGGKEQIHFTTDEKSFIKIIFTPEVFIIKLNINGKEIDTILQDAQYHPVTDKVLHADFLEVILDKPIIIGIPVIIEGNATGVLKGGRLIKKIRRLKAKALAKDLPDNIILNIDDLDIGDSIMVSDIKRDNVEFLDIPNAIIVGVRTARGAEEDEEEVEGEEVEGKAEDTTEENTEKKEEKTK
ncbi:MAG: 50S ribosomal protein L25/general stress protein Ctc [Bacteroidales bacterium]|nr:50S ribosomal protein L25/general stress protein Ctc [Bacteroidales bacterium]